MTFRWNGVELAYFDHPYNHTRLNMRRVEIPIVRWLMAREQRPKARVLEVGNVLSHYGPVSWPVVDLREAGAINANVMIWEPDEPVDLVVSISTIEHVRAAAPAVVARLRGFLAPGGMAAITAPTGYNAGLDEALRAGAVGAEWTWFMRALGGGEWGECTMEEALATSPRACAGRWSGGLMVLLCRSL